jgi:hypothetical protein
MTTKCWNCGRPLNVQRGAEPDAWCYCAQPESLDCLAVCAALARQAREAAAAVVAAADARAEAERWAQRVKVLEARAEVAAAILSGKGEA